tara:strand:- start:42 stop:188 length:147 start_codon:yes stop_codon:yes gene_type:complete
MSKDIKVTLGQEGNDFYFTSAQLKHVTQILEYQLKQGKNINIDIKGGK